MVWTHRQRKLLADPCNKASTRTYTRDAFAKTKVLHYSVGNEPPTISILKARGSEPQLSIPVVQSFVDVRTNNTQQLDDGTHYNIQQSTGARQRERNRTRTMQTLSRVAQHNEGTALTSFMA